MVEFEVKGLIVQVFPNNIKIINSYKIKTKKEMESFLEEVFEKAPIYKTKRTMGSLLREWKCHNRFYNKGLFISHTKDCDLESNEALYRRLSVIYLTHFNIF